MFFVVFQKWKDLSFTYMFTSFKIFSQLIKGKSKLFFPVTWVDLDTSTCKNKYYVIKQNTVSLFHESSCGHPLLNGYHIYFRKALAAMNWVYTMYLTDIST